MGMTHPFWGMWESYYFCLSYKMKTRKVKAHIKRRESIVRDSIGVHKNDINPLGAGIKITDGKEIMF